MDNGRRTGDGGQGIGYGVCKVNELPANGALGRGVSVKYNKF